MLPDELIGPSQVGSLPVARASEICVRGPREPPARNGVSEKILEVLADLDESHQVDSGHDTEIVEERHDILRRGVAAGTMRETASRQGHRWQCRSGSLRTEEPCRD